jgi:hypothetical protein
VAMTRRGTCFFETRYNILMIPRPDSGEFAPRFFKYINLVLGDDLLAGENALQRQSRGVGMQGSLRLWRDKGPASRRGFLFVLR